MACARVLVSCSVSPEHMHICRSESSPRPPIAISRQAQAILSSCASAPAWAAVVSPRRASTSSNCAAQ